MTLYIIVSDQKLHLETILFGIQLVYCSLACISVFEHKGVLYINAKWLPFTVAQ